jgi:hypothetical protein
MTKLTPLSVNRPPKCCFGCDQPFPIRRGHIEALVGMDGELYCYAMTPDCAARAMKAPALQSAA